MKKLLFYFLLCFTISNFNSVVLAQNLQQGQNQNEITNTPPQPTVRSPKPFTFNIQLSYDAFAKIKELKLSDEEQPFGYTKKSVSMISFMLSWTFITQHFRFTTAGLGITILTSGGSTEEGIVDDSELSYTFKQNEAPWGLCFNLIQVGYRIKLDNIEWLPYFGIDRQWIASDIDWDDNPLDITVQSMPIYIGTKMFWKKLFVGLETGYNIFLEKNYGLHDNSDEGKADVNKRYITYIQQNTGFHPGLIGKIVLGVAL